MSREELWQLFPIILKEPNPEYHTLYSEENKNISLLLADFDIRRISHIGSTYVEGLLAKPIIDILLELPEEYEMDTVIKILRSDGWLLMARDDKAKTLDLNKGYTPEGFADKVFHLHLKKSGDWDELYFRDYLVAHPEASRKYEELKKDLSIEYKHNRDAYTDAKSDFIKECTLAAREEFPERYLPAKEKVYAVLDKLCIEYIPVNHPALYSQADSEKRPVDMHGGVILKNLFLRNKSKSKYYLYVLPLEKKADLISLQRQICDSRLSFGNEESLMGKLGITKGSVSLLNIIGVETTDVEFLLDEGIFKYDMISLHPNDNTGSVVFSPNDIEKILNYYNAKYRRDICSM